MSNYPDTDHTRELNASARCIDALRISTDSPPKREHCQVIVEQFLTVMVEGIESYVIVCTPCDRIALAVGFLFSKGIIADADDICLLSRREDEPNVVRIRLADRAAKLSPGRNLAVPSSCGMHGARSLQDIVSDLRPVGNSLRVPMRVLTTISERMLPLQSIFTQTGGAHAAAIFSGDGGIVASAEDIGRHNALDKAIGKCVMKKQPTRGRGAFLSGRVGSQLALKAANAGIELIAAVSAPSSLAVDIARHCNITLCGFARGNRATVYAHPDRITDL